MEELLESNKDWPMLRNADISECGNYRYSLSRVWDDGLPMAVFVMLNPSTADAKQDDHTIRRCIGFAQKWNCGGCHVCNLFAFRATSPDHMKKSNDPVGPLNECKFKEVVSKALSSGGYVICAWGDHGFFRDQWKTALQWIREVGCSPMALKINTSGQPAHPLRLKSDLIPFSYPDRPC